MLSTISFSPTGNIDKCNKSSCPNTENNKYKSDIKPRRFLHRQIKRIKNTRLTHHNCCGNKYITNNHQSKCNPPNFSDFIKKRTKCMGKCCVKIAKDKCCCEYKD